MLEQINKLFDKGPQQLAFTHDGLSLAYLHLGQYDQAKYHNEQNMSAAGKLNIPRYIASSLLTWGRIALIQDDPVTMATYAMFSQLPDEVWTWYLYRRTVCRQAGPNAGHLALGDLERLLGDRFVLITQNVDGLHLQAGNSLKQTYQIHGNIDYGNAE